MKKIITIALLIVSLCVVGCSDNKPVPTKAPATPTGGK